MKKTKKNATKKHSSLVDLLFFFLLGTCNLACAVPVDPLVKDVTHRFSIDINNAFYLYADSKEDDLVWYISREGKIAVDNTGFDFPEFDIGSIYSDRSDFFYGEELVWIRGAFDTSGEDSVMQALKDEAHRLGYRVKAPKPKSVNTFFMLSAIDATELNLDCSEFIEVNGLKMPLCFVVNERDEKTPADFISMFRSKLPEDTLTKYIGFHGLTTPGWVENLKELMGLDLDVNDPNAGQNWADKIQAVATWELETAYNRPTATAAIDWSLVILSANQYADANGKYLTTPQAEGFYRQLIQNAINGAGNKGLKLTFTGEVPDLSIVQAEVKKLLKHRVFATKIGYVNPAADLVPGQNFRYVKRWIPIYNNGITIFVEADVKDFPQVVYYANNNSASIPDEQITFEYGPDTLVNSPHTIMVIECLRGGWFAPVEWVTNARCSSE